MLCVRSRHTTHSVISGQILAPSLPLPLKMIGSSKKCLVSMYSVNLLHFHKLFYPFVTVLSSYECQQHYYNSAYTFECLVCKRENVRTGTCTFMLIRYSFVILFELHVMSVVFSVSTLCNYITRQQQEQQKIYDGQPQWENAAKVANVKQVKESIHPINNQQLAVMQVR